MFNITAFLIIILSLVSIILIIYKKIPLLKQIKLEEVEREKRKKYQILEERLKRKLDQIICKVKRPNLSKRLTNLKNTIQRVFQTIKRKKSVYLAEVKKSKEEDVAFDPQKQLKENLLSQARELINLSRYQEGEEMILTAIKDDPKCLEAYKLLAESYLKNKNFVHAEATLEHIVKLASRLKNLHTLDYLQLAKTKLHLDKKNEALQLAEKAVSLEPLNPKILHFIIKVCIICRQKNLAWRYFRKLKKLNSKNNGLDGLVEELKKM